MGSIKHALRRAAERAGVPAVSPKTFRHTMATELRRRGVPAWEVSGMLGHKTGGTSEVYAKYDPDYLGHAAQAIDAYFGEMRGPVDNPLRSICDPQGIGNVSKRDVGF